MCNACAPPRLPHPRGGVSGASCDPVYKAELNVSQPSLVEVSLQRSNKTMGKKQTKVAVHVGMAPGRATFDVSKGTLDIRALQEKDEQLPPAAGGPSHR